jgi:lysophospholipase L1-like esterase
MKLSFERVQLQTAYLLKLFLFMILMSMTCSLTSQELNSSAKKRKILFIGDSITDGNWGGGGAKPSKQRNHWDKNHIFGSGFMYLTAAYYTAQYPSEEFEFYNRGISGHTLADLAARWEEDVLSIKPDVLSILIGTNDIYNFLKSDQKDDFDYQVWKETYQSLIDKVLEINPNTTIVLCTPFIGNSPKIQNYSVYEKMIDSISVVIRELSTRNHLFMVDFNTLFHQLQQSSPRTPSVYWLWDGIHPTAAAHYKMAEYWKQVMHHQMTTALTQ